MGTIDEAGSAGGTTGGVSPSPTERRSDAIDRRVNYDRREMIRFDEDRRSDIERRAGAGDAWTLRIGPG